MRFWHRYDDMAPVANESRRGHHKLISRRPGAWWGSWTRQRKYEAALEAVAAKTDLYNNVAFLQRLDADEPFAAYTIKQLDETIVRHYEHGRRRRGLGLWHRYEGIA